MLSPGCEEVNDLYTDGTKITTERSFDPYHSIWTYGIFDIQLVEDTTWKVIAKGKRNLINNLTYVQENRKIVVEEKKQNQWYRGTEKPQLEFHFKNLRYFRIEEPSCLSSPDTIHSDNLKIIIANELSSVDLTIDAGSFYLENWTTNTGTYAISGKCQNLHVRLFGSGEFKATHLNARHAVMENHSIANGYLFVRDTLKVYSLSKGDVYYTGNPEKIIFKRQGSGRLIQMQ
jgi:hypothetical protein